VKQIRASSSSERISRFINIPEFPSTRTLLNHSFSLYLSATFTKWHFKKWRFFIFIENAQLLPQTYGIYSNKDVLYLGPLKKCWLLKCSWYRSITLFCSEFYVTSYTIHLTQYIDKTYSVKQTCASVLLKLNIKLFFGIKHITQIKRCAIRRKMNVCRHIFSFFFSNSNIISKIAMPMFIFLIVSFYGHDKYTIFKDKI